MEKQIAVIAMLRVKNEARWLTHVLESLRFCHYIHVLNDYSTDHTAEIILKAGPKYLYRFSPFNGFDEARDKNFLLGLAMESAWRVKTGEVVRANQEKREAIQYEPWILNIDGDEVLADGAEDKVTIAAESGEFDAYSLQVLYLWDRSDQVRVDRRYGDFWRGSLFKADAALEGYRATNHGHGRNLHCGNMPGCFNGKPVGKCEAKLLHYGYMDKKDRLEKFAYYNQIDPNNEIEDRYRHMVIGDIPELPAESQLKWAGPLELKPLAECI